MFIIMSDRANPMTIQTTAAKRWVLAAAILGSSMAFIDSSVVNVALPVIQRDLHATVSGVQWIINGYLLMLGALILVGGSAGDLFGRRLVFALGIALFAAASVGCAVAPNLATLIGARVVQGIGGALLVPSSLSVISASFDEAERGQAIGTWAGFSALTTALGPLVGGGLVDLWSWRAIFVINVPLAAIAIAITLRHVPESRGAERGTSVDWRGASLVTGGLAAAVYGLTMAPRFGWLHPAVVGTMLGGIAILAAFLWFESRTASPMMPLALFRSVTFSGTNAMTVLLYFALSSVFFVLPFNLIDVQGYSATFTGAAFLPFTVMMGGLSRWTGGFVSRYGARTPLIVGPVITALGIGLFAVPGIGGSYWTTVFPAMLVAGLGMAISVAPLTTTVMGAVDQRHVGIASGINNAAARVGGLIAVAAIGAIAVAMFGRALEQRAQTLGVSAESRRALNAEVPRLAEAQVPAAIHGAVRQQLQRAVKEAYVASYRVVMAIAAAFALLSACCAALTIPKAGMADG
jgi:EmrB/QacA subfamily drug resistance transporter